MGGMRRQQVVNFSSLKEKRNKMKNDYPAVFVQDIINTAHLIILYRNYHSSYNEHIIL